MLTTDELIARIKPHCDEVGDCWEWRGAGVTPAMRVYVERPIPMRGIYKTVAVRRLILEARGIALGSARLATYNCANPKCVNPEHTVASSRKVLQARTAKVTQFGKSRTRAAKLAAKARARSSLDLAKVQKIREASGTHEERAKAHGVSKAAVGAILRGDTWRDYTNPFAQLMRT